jgi:plastocyanin
MDFWRSGQARPRRERPLPRTGPTRLWARMTGLYFPPWVPVAAVIVVVFGILGLLFVTRSATGAPRIGRDHWHASYQYFVCGERQPNAPEFHGGVHTHADGVIHIHPFQTSEEGAGARLVKWFEYGGGKLTQTEVRLPGQRTTYKNGDLCPDGSPGEVQVFVNGQKLESWTRYIPQDGDRIRIVFGPPEDVIQQEDRTIIPSEQATRTVEIEVSGNETATAFTPDTLEVGVGETVRINVRNVSDVSHGLRVAGPDREYDTADDFVVIPIPLEGQSQAERGDILQPGQDGFVVVRFDAEGNYEFRDPTAITATGTIRVREAEEGTPAPDDDQTAAVEVDVTMRDNVFDPVRITVNAGESFRINLTNEGQFIHNLRIAGPDGQFFTEDDLVAEVMPGESGELVGQIDEPGAYPFRDDFHRTEMTGELIVE